MRRHPTLVITDGAWTMLWSSTRARVPLELLLYIYINIYIYIYIYIYTNVCIYKYV